MQLSRRMRYRCIGWPCTIAIGALVMIPLNAAATPELGGPRAVSAAAGGTVYGGMTAQDFPVTVETSKNRRRVSRAVIAIRLDCTSGGTIVVPDAYTAMTVNRKRKFRASFGPITERFDDGTSRDYEGSISGTFNKARTKVTGTWSFTGTDRDAAGTITDTCASDSIRWSAKQ
jgi:hypothetical protein